MDGPSRPITQNSHFPNQEATENTQDSTPECQTNTGQQDEISHSKVDTPNQQHCAPGTSRTNTDYTERYQGTFNHSMRKHSINVLELLAIWMATLMIQENIVLRTMTDNTAALAAINRATSVTYHLAALAEMIWKRASALRWTITAAHIRGTFNVLADQLSRNTVISTEWSLPAQAFKQQVLIHEPRLQVDLLATSLNHQLGDYVSPCLD